MHHAPAQISPLNAAQATVDLVTQAGGQAVTEVADVRDAAAIAPLVCRCAAALGGLHGLMVTPMGRDATRRRPNRALAVPFGRQGNGWEVADACLYLRSHESSDVNAHALLVDGGLGIGVARSPAA